jgi:hypothetical protein
MDVWVPPELGDDLKTVEEIVFLTKNRALESKLISEEMDFKSDVRRAKWDTRSNQSELIYLSSLFILLILFTSK